MKSKEHASSKFTHEAEFGPSAAQLRDWDPEWADLFGNVITNPWTSGILPVKDIELLCIGIAVAATNLNEASVRRHVRAALAAGATRKEIMVVIKGGAMVTIHSCSLGAPILLEEAKAAGVEPANAGKSEPTPACDTFRQMGMWNTAWDPFFEVDPVWTDQFFAAAAGIYSGGLFTPKFIELLSVAVDASVTHMYAPGTRRHIKGALQAGASIEEVMEVLKLCVSFGVESCHLSLPILADELKRAGREE